MNLKISTTTNLSTPDGTKIIRNDEFITLARKDKKGIIYIFTCVAEALHHFDLNEDKTWTAITKNELQAICNI